MNNQNFLDFANAWMSASETLRGQSPTDRAVKMAFELLKEFKLDDVLLALTTHMKKNKWFPAPSEIIDLIVGVMPDDESLVGLAQSQDTQLGVFVRSEIGKHGNFENMSIHERRIAVRMSKPRIQRFVENARYGKFESDTLRLLINRGFTFTDPICRGYLSAPLAEKWEVIDEDKTRRLLQESRAKEQEQNRIAIRDRLEASA